MTMTTSHRSHRRLDLASLVLLLIGLAVGGLSYWLVADHGMNPLIIVPSVVAAMTGATHITKASAVPVTDGLHLHRSLPGRHRAQYGSEALTADLRVRKGRAPESNGKHRAGTEPAKAGKP